MARVYRAQHRPLERQVALKILLPEYAQDRSFAERFMREARIAARLVHPHIVQIYDVDQVQNELYLAMEFVKGGDLSSRIKQGVSARALLKIVAELCEALDFAHGEGYVHRDIKPPNILFRSDGSVVLSDFGIARSIRADAQLTQAGMILGTPSYMSPEQAEGRELTGASDLYGVGVMIYEVIAGRPPYRSDSSIDILHQHIAAPLPDLPDSTPHLQHFFNQALAKSPENRFASGAELVASLKRALVAEGNLPEIRKQMQQPAITGSQGHENTLSDDARTREYPAPQMPSAEETPAPTPVERHAGPKIRNRPAMLVAGLIVFVLAGAFLLISREETSQSREVVKSEKFDQQYIENVVDRTYDFHMKAVQTKKMLDGEIRRKMLLGNTGDQDVDHIINATIIDRHAELNRYTTEAVSGFAELADHYVQSTVYVDKVLKKKAADEENLGNPEKSAWLRKISQILKSVPDSVSERDTYFKSALTGFTYD